MSKLIDFFVVVNFSLTVMKVDLFNIFCKYIKPVGFLAMAHFWDVVMFFPVREFSGVCAGGWRLIHVAKEAYGEED